MTNEAIQRLEQHGIKSSAQRISIMEYLLTHKTHPTVNAIYNDLIGSMPTLSRTTVYNTLKLLSDNNAVAELTIDKQTAHYDGVTEPHSHFMCRHCGRIFDIPLQQVADTQDTQEFKVEETEVYLRGICKDCLDKSRTIHG